MEYKVTKVTWGCKLKYLRKIACGLTREKLSKIVGVVSPYAIARYESYLEMPERLSTRDIHQRDCLIHALHRHMTSVNKAETLGKLFNIGPTEVLRIAEPDKKLLKYANNNFHYD